MKVDSTLSTTQAHQQTTDTWRKSQGDFQAALDMAKQNLVQSSEEKSQSKSSTSNAQASVAAPKTAAEELDEFLRMTPAERMRAAILREMGLTEEDLDAMPPEKRAAAEETIARKIKEILLREKPEVQEVKRSPVELLSLLN